MQRTDPAWLNEQYNNRARVPEHPEIFERWARASVMARNGLARLLDVPYGDGPNEVLDVFPSPKPDAPVLVFIHGGWWRAFDKADHSFVAPAFVHSGAMVVVPNYALCPAVHIEDIALQMVKALAWVARNARDHGGDPERIVVAGHSAGAHLAAMLMCCDWKAVGADLAPDLASRALAISGVYDLEPLRQTTFLQPDLRLSEQSVRKLSPAGFPPPTGTMYAIAGGAESEEFVRQNSLIRERWGERVVPVCETLPGIDHFSILHELVDPDARLHMLAKQLLGLPVS